MKKVILLLILITFSLSSCKKLLGDKEDTIAVINLYDRNNHLLSGWKVYAFTDEHFQLYGADRQWADKTVVTNNSGTAKFILNDINGLFDHKRQETIVFYVFYTIGTNSTVYQSGISITFEEGDRKIGDLHLN